jgi:hypothetical protein
MTTGERPTSGQGLQTTPKRRPGVLEIIRITCRFAPLQSTRYIRNVMTDVFARTADRGGTDRSWMRFRECRRDENARSRDLFRVKVVLIMS